MSTALVSFYDFGDHCSYRSNSASTALQNTKSGFASTQVERKTNIASVYNSVQQNNNNNNNINNNLTHNNNLINNNLNNNVMTRRVVTTTASVPIGLSQSHRLHSNSTTTVPVMHPKSPIGVSNTQPSVALVRGLSTGSQTCSISNNNNNNNVINGNNNKEHKKLDRSYSEPAEKSQLARMNSTTVAGPMSSRYKTELCRSFGEVGTCKYGDKCQFAHGGHELRVITRHPKFKTENCKSFHSTGFCPYGPRCHFIHNSEESKTNILNNLQGSNGNSGQSNGSQPRMADHNMNANLNMNGKNSITNNGFGSTYHSNNNSHPLRPKALSIGSYSLGSSGEISPPSSQSGSPTSLNSFFTEDPFNPFASPSNHALGSCANNAFSFSPDFASLVTTQHNKNTGLSTFGGSQPTLCPPFPLPNNINADSDQSVVPTMFSNTFTTTSSTTLDHHMNEGSQGMTRTPPPQPTKVTPVSYPVASESPVDSIASDVDALKLEQNSRSPIPACSSPLDVSKNLPRLPIFTRFANNGSNANNDLE
jgi:butyrate response factor 1